MSPEQRLRMRRLEVVCQRAIARVQGIAEPSVSEVLANARVIDFPQDGSSTARASWAIVMLRGVLIAFVAIACFGTAAH